MPFVWSRCHWSGPDRVVFGPNTVILAPMPWLIGLDTVASVLVTDILGPWTVSIGMLYQMLSCVFSDSTYYWGANCKRLYGQMYHVKDEEGCEGATCCRSFPVIRKRTHLYLGSFAPRAETTYSKMSRTQSCLQTAISYNRIKRSEAKKNALFHDCRSGNWQPMLQVKPHSLPGATSGENMYIGVPCVSFYRKKQSKRSYTKDSADRCPNSHVHGR